MDPVAAKFLGAGLACIGMGGAAIGVATVFGQFLTGALRNPSAAAGQKREPLSRVCARRSVWHLLAADCPVAAVRPVSDG